MLFGKALTGALIAAAFASAQDDEPNGTHNTPNRVVEDRIPVTHVVKVGPVSDIKEQISWMVTDLKQNGHDFSPAELVANVSDIIAFHFFPKDHSVARAEYLTPCQPIEYTSPQKAPSFWSGFVIVDTPQADGPWFNVTVNDTEPIWYYCSQVKACSPDGMVGVVWVDGVSESRSDAESFSNMN